MTLNEIKNECFSTVVDLYPLEILTAPGRDLSTDISDSEEIKYLPKRYLNDIYTYYSVHDKSYKTLDFSRLNKIIERSIIEKSEVEKHEG
tara:strand:- start:180 stop:449 length:270 start_codon:yes stop_codon:yes gene_type:complete